MNNYKNLPANCRQRLAAEGKFYPRSGCAFCGQFSPKSKECDAIIDTAQPPALGGEPEVLGKVVSFGEGLKEISWAKGKMPEFGVELIDRAHLAPLQAEIERLKAWGKANGDLAQTAMDKAFAANHERDQLKARLDDAELLLLDAGKEDWSIFVLRAEQFLLSTLSKPAGSEQ